MTKSNNSISFAAIMKKLEVKALVSMDKGGRLLLEFNVEDDDLISGLNSLMRADGEVLVTIQGQ